MGVPASLMHEPGERARTGASRFARIALALAALAAIGVFVAAGQWQRSRMLDKEAQGAALAAAAGRERVALPRTDDWYAWRFRPVRLDGEWVPDRQFLVDNRVHAGRAGFQVFAPLRLDDGRVVLVDRGWVAAGAGATRIPEVAMRSGRAEVDGRVALPPSRYLELDAGAPSGAVWQNLDVARLAAATGLALLPIVVEETGTTAAEGLRRDRPPPDAGARTHEVYMMQWYAFAAVTAALWIGFAVRDRLRRKDGR